MVKEVCCLLSPVTTRTKNRFFGKFPDLRPLANPGKANGTEVSNFVNGVIGGSSNGHYLEVGVWTGRTIEAINFGMRTAVDPKPRYFFRFARGVRTFKCTSDDFFSNYSVGPFDFVYLDGLHHFNQTWKDVCNSAAVMKPHGLILIDDVVPIDSFSALTPQDFALKERRKYSGSDSIVWHGDVFKVMFLLEHLPKNFMFGLIEFRKNPRAFILSRDGDWTSFPEIDDGLIQEAQDREANSVFGFNPTPNIPKSFHPMSPESAMKIIREHLASFGVS